MKSPPKENLGRTIAILTVTAVMLTAPLAAFILYAALSHEEEGGAYIPSGTGDGSLQDTTRERWERYLIENPASDEPVDGPVITWAEEQKLQEVTDLDASIDAGNATYKADPNPPKDASSDGADREGSGALDDADGSSSGDDVREVEESDIVKAAGDHLFILNPYLGLIVADISDPSSPEIVGRLDFRGSPVSMYIVDFLAFVIVSAPSSYYFRGADRPEGALHIINVMDPADPQLVRSVALSGYPLDSRRVGEVIYVVSNQYGYYNIPMRGVEIEGDTSVVDEAIGSPDDYPSDETEIVSISFSDPETIGEKDRTTFEGTSSNICVSDIAIFLSKYDYAGSNPRTGITYVDISDPAGEISVRGSITVDGWLADRYQMDHYDGYFRMVTQEWGASLPTSTLYIVSCSDPDSLRVVGKLVIDDAGSLMATRFAGPRGYTIHLPRSIDPLDVLDLSDPADPKLCDVLEMPGWVEHMEVVGYSIVAIGVDDSSGTWQVALSLFDVTDPDNAVMLDRVVMGEGASYSPANWDPKALTIDTGKGLVLVPYTSYDYYSYTSENMVQIVSLDLEAGDLSLRGAIETDSAPTRTRVVGDSVLATSEMELISAGVADPDHPTIDAVLKLTSQYSDAGNSGDLVIATVSPTYGDDRAYIRVMDPDNEFEAISETGVEGLSYQDVRLCGDTAFIKGLRIGTDTVDWEVHAFDVSDPSKVAEKAYVTIPITDMFVWYKELPYEDGSSEEGAEGGKDVSTRAEVSRLAVYYDPMQYMVLSDGTLVVWAYAGYYTFYEGGTASSLKAWIIDWAGEASATLVDLGSWYYIEKAYGGRDRILLSTVVWENSEYYYGYGQQGSALKVLERGDSGYDVSDLSVRGSVIGTSSDLGKVYTIYSWYDQESGGSGFALLTYALGVDGAELVDSSALPSYSSALLVSDDLIVLSEGGYYYGYYDMGYGGAERAVVDSPDQGVASKEAPGSDDAKTVLWAVRLSDGIPDSIRSFTIDGYVYQAPIDGGLFLQGSDVLTGFSIDGTSIQKIGSWAINGYVCGGEYSSGKLVIAKGLWGIERIE